MKWPSLGFGNLAIAGDMRPSITTVDVDGARIGREAVSVLRRRAAGEKIAQRVIDVGLSADRARKRLVADRRSRACARAAALEAWGQRQQQYRADQQQRSNQFRRGGRGNPQPQCSR